MADRKLNVLIADDEEGLRLSMAGILELEGHRVVTAADGDEAVARAREHAFDIAFLDIKMPGINGVEAFKEIKKLQPEIVVIMMTAFAVNDLIKEAIEEGAYACINKPFDMDRIIDTMKEVADKPFVLVIDQDPALCDQLHTRLKDSGCVVITRSSGMAGIELAQRKIPDVIFLDMVMKDMNGIETLKKLKEILGEKCPKTVIISAEDLPQEFDEALRLGAVECLRKPFEPETIISMIESIEQQRKQGKKPASNG